MRKLTQQEFEKKLKKVHGDQFAILSAYKNTHSKVKVRCNLCGWIGEVQAGHLLNPNYGTQCPTHGERQFNSSSFENRVKKIHGGQFAILSSYHGMSSKVKVRCNVCGWIGETLPDHLLRQNYGSRCPSHGKRQFDSSSFQKTINQTQDNQYVLLSKFTNFKTKVNIKCNICGEEFYVWPCDLLNRRFGKNCNHEIQLNFEQAAKRLNRILAGEIKLIHFSGMGKVATFKHLKCGNTWQTAASNVFGGSTGCPYCSSSKGEKAVTEYLKENEISFKPQFTFSNCRDQRTLPFDFAVFNRDGSLNSVIEYEGCQHYTSIFLMSENTLFSKKAILKTQEHDVMKSAFCQKHGIKLIYINHPQDTSKSNKSSFITDLVKKTLDKELKVS